MKFQINTYISTVQVKAMLAVHVMLSESPDTTKKQVDRTLASDCPSPLLKTKIGDREFDWRIECNASGTGRSVICYTDAGNIRHLAFLTAAICGEGTRCMLDDIRVTAHQATLF